MSSFAITGGNSDYGSTSGEVSSWQCSQGHHRLLILTGHPESTKDSLHSPKHWRLHLAIQETAQVPGGDPRLELRGQLGPHPHPSLGLAGRVCRPPALAHPPHAGGWSWVTATPVASQTSDPDQNEEARALCCLPGDGAGRVLRTGGVRHPQELPNQPEAVGELPSTGPRGGTLSLSPPTQFCQAEGPPWPAVPN